MVVVDEVRWSESRRAAGQVSAMSLLEEVGHKITSSCCTDREVKVNPNSKLQMTIAKQHVRLAEETAGDQIKSRGYQQTSGRVK